MDLFDDFNTPNPLVASNGKYKRMSQLPLFVPMKITYAGPYTTVNGPTIKMNVILNDEKLFFFLSEADYLNFLEKKLMRRL